MPPHDRSSSASKAVHERREKLLSQARSIAYDKGFAASGNFLAGKLDMDVLDDILNDLDATSLRIRATLPPDAPLPPDIGDNEKDGHDGLRDLSTVLYGLYGALGADNSSKLQSLMDTCIEKLHLRWADVAKWIMLCAEKISPADFIPGHWNTVMGYCIQILEPIFFDLETNHFQREIATTNASIDIIFCLLGIIDPRTKRPARLKFNSGSRCAIAGIFWMAVQSEAGDSMSSRLECLPVQTKQEIVKSIIWRIQDILTVRRDKPEDIPDISADLLHLVDSSCTLIQGMGAGGEFAHRDIIFESTRVLLTVLEDTAAKKLSKPDSSTLDNSINALVTLAAWPSLAHRAMEGLFEGGFIPCILRSLLYTDTSDPRSRGLKGPAWRLLPFITDSRIYHAAKKGGGNPELFKELEAIPKSKPVESIYNAYSSALRFCKAAFADKDCPVQMCYSLKHQLPNDDSSASTELKTCSTCHAAYYCSRECQKEDWATFHSVECLRALQRWRKNLKAAGMTERIEREKLMFIQVLANRFLPPLPDIVAREKGDSDGGDVTAKVHVFDLAGKLFRQSKTPKFMEYESMTLPDYFKKYTFVIGDRTQARLGNCAQDVKADPESAVLVAGTFLGQLMIICICAKMQYNPAAAAGERYRAVTHACSVLTFPPALAQLGA